MTEPEESSGNSTSANIALDGYWYQVKVSILVALDLLAYKQATDSIVLEPASQEDLETEIEDEPDVLTQTIKVGTRCLVIQCKRKTTGPWTEGDLRRLLAHGTKRTKPKDRLKNSAINYLLVTSADLAGVARDLAVGDLNQWSRVQSIPAKIAKLLPFDAPGRLAVWSALNDEMLDARLEKHLTKRFRVPYSKVDACVKALKGDALDRMRGAGGGVWTRDEVMRTIQDHDGYDSTSYEDKNFVHPSNWDAIREKLNTKHAVVITGPSGTGKTTTANALVAELREETPGIRHERVRGGPEQIRDDQEIGPVIYEIEDPWGKYRLAPQSIPWNDSINDILASASSDKKFVITSRSDILLEAGLKTLDDRFAIKLEDDHYTKIDRIRMFENRLAFLPHADQVAALKYKKDAIDSLFLPLEIERFFSGVTAGPIDGENESTHLRRCLSEASEGAIESSLVNGIKQREHWAQAAVIWAMMKALKRIPFEVFNELEWALITRDTSFEDKLESFVDFLIAGRNLKLCDSVLSCAHPRVELGLEKATLEKPKQATRAITNLIEALIALDTVTNGDWWLEAAVYICAATFPISILKVNISKEAQAKVDQWLEDRLSSLENTFREDLKLAIAAGSKECAAAELARWLDDSPIDKEWFNMVSWEEPERSSEWYEWVSSAQYTRAICQTYIERVLGFKNGSFHGDFHEAIARLSPNLTPSFIAGLSNVIQHGYNPNSVTLINGAIVDLEAYEAVLEEAADLQEKLHGSHDRNFWMALYNQDYDDQAAEHYFESAHEDGHTAGEVIEAYVVAHRQSGNWPQLAGHPRLNALLWAWVKRVNSDVHASEDEMIALAEASNNHRQESYFWQAAEKHFSPRLSDLLAKRLSVGSQDRDARTNAATVAVKYPPELLDQLLKKETTLSPERLLELTLDIQQSLEANKTPADQQRSLIENLTCNLDAQKKEAIKSILEFADNVPNKAVLDFLRSIPVTTRPELNLAVAKALASSGDDVTARLHHLLTTEFDVTTENIGFVEKVMELVVKLDNDDLIAIGLKHEFARCRVVAMNAVDACAPMPLPATLLDMRNDSSSSVRKNLVEFIEAKPHPAHVDALIDLTSDTWTSDHYYDGDAASYPIAEKAAELLLVKDQLTDESCDRLVKSLKETDSLKVKRTLLQGLVRFGSTKRRNRLIGVAVSDENPPYPLFSAQALSFEADYVETHQLDVITDEVIASVRPLLACWLTLLITGKSDDDRIVALASSLAVNKDRRAILALLYFMVLDDNKGGLQEPIGDMLPSEARDALFQIFQSRDTSDLKVLDDLGDVRTVEVVKSLARSYLK